MDFLHSYSIIIIIIFTRIINIPSQFRVVFTCDELLFYFILSFNTSIAARWNRNLLYTSTNIATFLGFLF